MSSSLNGNASTEASTSTSATPSPSTAHEVGWLFVPQYYTFMNQNPGRLHCFYTKRSTLSHGEESVQDITPCFGQQEIHDRITSFNYQDAKVWVSTIDSQASANGGIVIQVIGELSNNNGPWRRFAQTFFLAEQPKGYFVLNDIFRFLKDENEVEGIAEALDEDAEAKAVAEQQDALNAPEISVVASSTATNEEKPSEVVLENVNQPGATPHVEPQTSSSEPKETLQSIADSVTDNSVAPIEAAPTSEKEAPAPEPTKEVEPVPAPAASTPTPSQAPAAAESAPAPTPAPAAPAAPKTWANLAASGASKWGSNVSAETRASSARPAAASTSPASRPAVSTGPKPVGNGAASSSSSNPSVFIKSVNLDMVTQEELRTGLESQYGKLRECSVIPSKGCAFAEFVNQDHARKAIKDSLPVSQGGQGGITVGKRNWVITIEEKRGAGQKPSNAGGARGGGGRGGANQGARNGGAARNHAPRGRTQAA